MTQTTFDVFLSYASSDRKHARLLVEALREQGLDVWFDETELGDFSSISATIQTALLQSKAFVAYYSRDYPTRRPCQAELVAAYLAAQRAGDPRSRVLAVNPEASETHFAHRFLRDTRVPRLAAGEERDAAAAIRDQVTKLVGSLADHEAPRPGRWYGWAGVGSNRFVGRLEEMWAIHDALHQSEAVIVTGKVPPDIAQVRGLGGIGKSLLVEEYALRFGAAFPGGVYWLWGHGTDETSGGLGAAGRETERQSQFRTFAIQHGLDVENTPPEVLEANLATALEGRRLPYLWIVDDMPSGLSETERRRWLAPSPLGRTIITTRARDHSAAGAVIDLGLLGADDAFRLLVARREPAGARESDAARELVEFLGRHALALDVAGGAALALAEDEPYRYLLELLRKPDKDALELAAQLTDSLPNGHERSIATTLLCSVRLLDEVGKDFLRLASLLAPEPIPTELVNTVLARAGGSSGEAIGLRAGAAVARLSLADRSEGETTGWLVHRLVARTVRFHDARMERRLLLRKFAVEAIVSRAADAEETSLLGVPQHISHARHLAADADRQERAELLSFIGRFDSERGDYRSARRALSEVLEIRTKLLGRDAPESSKAAGNLATVEAALGEFARARTLAEQALIGFRKFGGTNRALEFKLMCNLAWVLFEQGQLETARGIAESVLEHEVEGETVFAQAKGVLAAVLLTQGHAAAAAPLAESALAILTRANEAESELAITCLNLIGAIHEARDDLSRAQVSYEKALEVCRRVLGARHPRTVDALGNLAGSLRAGLGSQLPRELAKPERARDLANEAIALAHEVYGEDHPTTIRLEVLAASLDGDDGNFAAAEQRLRITSERLESKLGTEHVLVLRCRLNWAMSLTLLDRFSDAAAALEPILEVSRKVLGPTNPETTHVAYRLLEVMIKIPDQRGFHRIMQSDLKWLVDANPDSLSPEQQRIRTVLSGMRE